MKKSKDNFVYIKHIRDAIEKIYQYSLKHTKKRFCEK